MSQLDTLIDGLGNARDALLTAAAAETEPISRSFLEECADAASRTLGSIQTEIEPAANEQLDLEPAPLTVTVLHGTDVICSYAPHHSVPALDQVLWTEEGKPWRVIEVGLIIGSTDVTCRVNKIEFGPGESF